MNFANAVVPGSDDVGSAVAHALHMRGVNVIVHDDPRPAHPRRGRAFTDALFGGQAVLDELSIAHDGGVPPARIQVDCRVWQDGSKLPARVSGGPLVSALQRFALCKITTNGPLRGVRPALADFGVLPAP